MKLHALFLMVLGTGMVAGCAAKSSGHGSAQGRVEGGDDDGAPGGGETGGGETGGGTGETGGGDTDPAATPVWVTAYKKAVAGCFTGRANGFALPGAAAHELNSQATDNGFDLASQWNYGTPYGMSSGDAAPYTAAGHGYAGIPFTPAGEEFDASVHILPPYNWGAVGQKCDGGWYSGGLSDEQYATCVQGVQADLADTAKNYFIDDFHFYYVAHGHNCHDAAEDVGSCLLTANDALDGDHTFDVKVVVWDGASSNGAKGNVYHSQLLVKMQQPTADGEETVVCLAESQRRQADGDLTAGCCTNQNVDTLWAGADAAAYAAAFPKTSCGDNLDPAGPAAGVEPHIYDVASFRNDRATGTMDMDNSYDREAGKTAVGADEVPAPADDEGSCTIEYQLDDNGIAKEAVIKGCG